MNGRSNYSLNIMPAWVGLARTHLANNRLVEAREAHVKARAIAPNHPAVQQIAIELAQR